MLLSVSVVVDGCFKFGLLSFLESCVAVGAFCLVCRLSILFFTLYCAVVIDLPDISDVHRLHSICSIALKKATRALTTA